MNKSELLAVAKPILFNTPMVQAILSNRKSETRRIIKYPACGYFEFEPPKVKEPYRVGDILYVRETWCKTDCFGLQNGYVYKADGVKNDIFKYTGFTPKWRPSIHMPKEAARIFLRVTDVRVERLQDITIKGAINEGVPDVWIDEARPMKFVDVAGNRNMFVDIWDSTIKKTDLRYGWNANPFVWVIEFERLEIEK